MLSSKFQSHSIRFEDFKINPINPVNPITTKRGSKHLNLLLGMSYNVPKMVGSEFQSPSIKIDDVCLREGVSDGVRE